MAAESPEKDTGRLFLAGGDVWGMVKAA